jgi:membrane-associated phospholipid phosphatase
MISELTARFPVHLRLKLWGVGLYIIAGAGYLMTRQRGADHGRTMPWTPFDLWVPEIPALVWVYLAQLAVLGIPTWLMIDRSLLRAHLLGYVVINVIAITTFVVVPTRVAPFEGGAGLLMYVRQWDGVGNACPSLHAACVVYAALALPRALPVTTWVMVLTWTWVALVLLACLSLRQHSGYDLAAGALLGVLADCGSRWWQHRHGAVTT